MKKVVIKIFLIITILFVSIKIFHFIIVYKANKSINSFLNENNRYYSVDNGKNKIELLKNNNIVKHNLYYHNKLTYTEKRNFESFEQENIDNKYGNKNGESLKSEYKQNLHNLPSKIYKKNIFISAMNIRFITYIDYLDQKCLKIYTGDEEIILNKDTYLPICDIIKYFNNNSKNNDEMKYTYEFKINCVTDEDMK